ncbi:hypothetical protein [Azonexus hydrophilus]|uniref:hypothetical protein n=1 Tax=Azonexus hydrophilus TaxID=418702 RepID=UPI00048A80D2|nr:hypothetical protein [Azonexus hydrophilus]
MSIAEWQHINRFQGRALFELSLSYDEQGDAVEQINFMLAGDKYYDHMIFKQINQNYIDRRIHVFVFVAGEDAVSVASIFGKAKCLKVESCKQYPGVISESFDTEEEMTKAFNNLFGAVLESHS